MVPWDLWALQAVTMLRVCHRLDMGRPRLGCQVAVSQLSQRDRPKRFCRGLSRPQFGSVRQPHIVRNFRRLGLLDSHGRSVGGCEILQPFERYPTGLWWLFPTPLVATPCRGAEHCPFRVSHFASEA